MVAAARVVAAVWMVVVACVVALRPVCPGTMAHDCLVSVGGLALTQQVTL